jgi:hypothetical protein
MIGFAPWATAGTIAASLAAVLVAVLQQTLP